MGRYNGWTLPLRAPVTKLETDRTRIDHRVKAKKDASTFPLLRSLRRRRDGRPSPPLFSFLCPNLSSLAFVFGFLWNVFFWPNRIEWGQIRFILLQNRQGKTRLAKYYIPLEDSEKHKVEYEVRVVLPLFPRLLDAFLFLFCADTKHFCWSVGSSAGSQQGSQIHQFCRGKRANL